VQDWPWVALLVLVIAATFWTSWRRVGRAKEVLAACLEKDGYSLVSADPRALLQGPFTWTSGGAQVVYRIEVMRSGGESRSGWAKVGSWLVGLLVNQVDIRWDGDS
jgi:hypothetical protein